MSGALRVLHLIKGLGRGGAERLVVDHVKFGNRGAFHYEVAYLLPWKDALVAEAESAGAPVRCLEARSEYDLRWTLRLRDLVSEHDIDIVHVHSPLVAAFARLALHPGRKDLRIVYTLHNRSDSHRARTRVLDRVTLRFDAVDLAVSNSVRSSLPERMRSRFEVLYHGIDVAALDAVRSTREEARRELDVLPEDVVITTVANLRRTKDHETLLRAAKLVLARSPHARFLVVGQGPLERSLHELHRTLGFGDRVRLLGGRDDVPSVLAGSDVFALSSQFEGLPVALMEALAVGVPVVATDVGGVPELVNDGAEGRLVPPRRPDSFAEALISLIEAPAERSAMAAAAQARGRQLDVRRAISTIEARYESGANRDA